MDSMTAYVADLRAKRDKQTEALRRTEAALDSAEQWLTQSDDAQPISESPRPVGPRSASASPSGPQLVEQVLSESDTTWNAADMLAEMLRREWQSTASNPIDAVRTALSRAVSKGVAERAGEGRYRRKQTESHDESAEDAVAVAAPTASSSPSLNGTGLPWHEGASTP